MEITLSRKTIAKLILRTMASEQARGAAGRTLTLTELVTRLGLRRSDVRSALSQLHREGHVDALRMRLTLSGFAIGAALPRARVMRSSRRAASAA